MSSDPAFSSDPAVMSRPDSRWRERHAVLAAGYGGRDDPADPALVLAMPIVLHIPKADPAQAHRTARGCGNGGCGAVSGRTRRVHRRRGTRPVARGTIRRGWVPGSGKCLAERVEPSGSPRKRCRESPSTWMVPRRGLWFPGPVGELDPRIKKLQIGGDRSRARRAWPAGAWSSCAVDRLGARDDGRQGVGTGRACLDVVGGGHVRETCAGPGRRTTFAAQCAMRARNSGPKQ